MGDKRKIGVLAAGALFLVSLVAAVVIVKSYVWPDVAVVPIDSTAVAATQPVVLDTPEYFSQVMPNFASEDFRHDAVLMQKPNGKVASEGGVYFIESSPGTFWAWNRPWGPIHRDFACEVVGRVASGSGGKWALYITTRESPRQGIFIRVGADGTLEIGKNAFADANANEVHVGPITNPAIKTGAEFNRLLVVVKGQELSVFVNGVSVCEPVHLLENVIPGVVALSGSAGPDEASRAEFSNCLVWRLKD